LLRRSGKDDWSVVPHRCFQHRDVRQTLIFNAHEFRGGLRNSHADRGDGRDRLTVIAHERKAFVRLDAGIAQLSDRQDAIENVHGFDAGISLRRRCVDRLDASVRHGAAHDACVQHAGQSHVVRVTRLARNLRNGIDTVDALADDAQLRVRRQRRRLAARNFVCNRLQRVADDAGQNGATLACIWSAHVPPPFLLWRTAAAAANVALKMLG
jgi:hypothetical protein